MVRTIGRVYYLLFQKMSIFDNFKTCCVSRASMHDVLSCKTVGCLKIAQHHHGVHSRNITHPWMFFLLHYPHKAFAHKQQENPNTPGTSNLVINQQIVNVLLVQYPMSANFKSSSDKARERKSHRVLSLKFWHNHNRSSCTVHLSMDTI